MLGLLRKFKQPIVGLLKEDRWDVVNKEDGKITKVKEIGLGGCRYKEVIELLPDGSIRISRDYGIGDLCVKGTEERYDKKGNLLEIELIENNNVYKSFS